jgi:hypothetical protein
MPRKRNVVRLLTVDATAGDNRSIGGKEDDEITSQSQKLISHLPASNTLTRKHQPITGVDPIDDENSTIASLAPSHLSLDQTSFPQQNKYSTEKYFGNYAKNSFNDRFKWICRVNNDLISTEEVDLRKTTILETPFTQINDFPFAVKRPDQEEEEDSEEEEGTEEREEEEKFQHQISSEETADRSVFSRSRRPQSSRARSPSPPGQRPSSPCPSLSSPLPSLSLSLTLSRSSPRSTSAYSSALNPSKHSSSTSLEGPPTSPRSKYLVGCLRESLNPRASLILRKHVNHDLNLQHLGMGDKMGLVFASSLSELPHVSSLNLCDNNLTDKSLSEIIQTISQMSQLTSLNLSVNKIDSRSCQALAEYLLQPFCGLKSLNLHKADIDDFECHMFVAALGHNTVSLVTLPSPLSLCHVSVSSDHSSSLSLPPLRCWNHWTSPRT